MSPGLRRNVDTDRRWMLEALDPRGPEEERVSMTAIGGTPDRPTRIARYRVLGELGRGMMGVVYKAQDPLLGRTIALKTIRPTFALSPEEHTLFEKRFFSEAQIAARLTHPGIVVVYDVGRDPETGSLYMALEFLDGRTLSELIKERSPLEWREALRIVERVAEALHHAHFHGVIHRDIKPANIMILPSGEPKIMDFGIAKLETAQVKLTMAGQFFGTPLYMSPEQALGQELDARTDLFSLGAIAYVLLTGRAAFEAENLTRIIGRVVGDDPFPPSRWVAGLTPEVDYVLARALAKSPTDRYPDGNTFAEDVSDIVSDRPARHRQSWEPTRRPVALATSRNSAGPDLVAELEGHVRAARATRPQAVDLEAEIDTLLSGKAGSPPRVGVPAAATSKSAAAQAAQAPRRRITSGREGLSTRARTRRLGSGALVIAAVVATLAVPATLLKWRSAAPPDTPSTPAPVEVSPSDLSPPGSTLPAAAPPDPAPMSHPEATASGEASPSPVPSSAAPASIETVPPLGRADAAAASARLAIDFEHPLGGGTLRVWVDGHLVVNQDLEGKAARKIAGITLRMSRVEEVIAVTPATHAIRVEVAWEDNLKTEELSGTFKTGATRHLEVRLGRLRKNISLEWE